MESTIRQIWLVTDADRTAGRGLNTVRVGDNHVPAKDWAEHFRRVVRSQMRHEACAGVHIRWTPAAKALMNKLGEVADDMPRWIKGRCDDLSGFTRTFDTESKISGATFMK